MKKAKATPTVPSTRNVSAYVLERRANPELRTDADREALAKAEAKRARKAST